jgi:hypothetical protein
MNRFGVRLRGGLVTEFVFTVVYRFKLWGWGESASGPGSSLHATQRIREKLPALFRNFEIRTVLDAPCGDYHWMKHAKLELEMYTGCDIVRKIFDENRRKWADARTAFLQRNVIIDPLPRVDLILCRDCFVHFSTTNILATLRNFRASRSKYLLATTHRRVARNGPLLTGLWRRVNLERPPYSLPAPLQTIQEPPPLGRDYGKCLALWKLEELPE